MLPVHFYSHAFYNLPFTASHQIVCITNECIKCCQFTFTAMPFTTKEVCDRYFKHVGDDIYKCTIGGCSVTRKKAPSAGYQNLFSHVAAKHPNCKSDMQSTSLSIFTIPEKARNIYGWLELIVMNGEPFNLVENEYHRKYSNLSSICRNTFMKYLQELTKTVELKIKDELPENFGLVFDGF